MTLVLDSGALIALERNDRAMWTRLKSALLADEPPVSHGGIVGQVWRGKGPRQALLARALAAIHICGIDESLGRATGALLARARRDDVIDAALVVIAQDGDRILTSDPDDLLRLARAADRHVEILEV